MFAQLVAMLVMAVACALLFGPFSGLTAFWGGAICLLAHAWAGYQMWLHPRLRIPRHQAGSAIRAEMGKVAITLLLFWLSFSEWPLLREQLAAGTLLTGFFVTQVAGWIWLVRATGAAAPPGSGNNTLDG